MIRDVLKDEILNDIECHCSETPRDVYRPPFFRTFEKKAAESFGLLKLAVQSTVAIAADNPE
jgi:hypothetical protein